MKVAITGSGAYLPEGVVTNEDLGPRLGLDPDFIVKASGIRRRRWAAAGTPVSQLAAQALRLALDDESLAGEEIDYLIVGTMTPDRFIPGTAYAVQSDLGLSAIPCLDIRAACCNALYALQLAAALVRSGAANRVAICLAEVQSAFLDISAAAGKLSMLFGDGASALIVSQVESAAQRGASHPIEIIDVLLGSDGAYCDDLGIRCPGSQFGGIDTHPVAEHRADYAPRMMGQSVILQASRRMVAACRTVLERNQLAAGEVQWVVPHQANANLLAQVARGLGFADNDERVISVLAETGNTSSASIGIALDSLRRSGKIHSGDYLLLPAFAAGFTWGAALGRAL